MKRPVFSVLCASTSALVFIAPPAYGQRLSNGTTAACIDSADAKDLRRVAAFLISDAEDSAPEILKPVDLLTEILAERLRKMLGGGSGQLPMGEPIIRSRNIDGRLSVTLRRDGTFTSVVVPRAGSGDTTLTLGMRMVERALQDAWKEGDKVFWPEKAKGDSATFHFSLLMPLPKESGDPYPMDERFGSAVFSLAVPWMENVTLKSVTAPVYPASARSSGWQGTIELSFVVDSIGHPLISTMRDKWPSSVPRPQGRQEEMYRAFVTAASEALLTARFNPARIVGCRVNQRVNQPFTFILRR